MIRLETMNPWRSGEAMIGRRGGSARLLLKAHEIKIRDVEIRDVEIRDIENRDVETGGVKKQLAINNMKG